MSLDLRVSPFDAQLDASLLQSIDIGRQRSLKSGVQDLSLYDVLTYHLGLANESFGPERADVGKRIRPRLCVLACQATGGNAASAGHAAASIELLHNFTLLHDDIQDQSPLRRHRRTVWSIWGVPQAINAGDAMFAIAHLALNQLVDDGVDPAIVLSLSTELHQTTLRIVEGQVLDLSFEQRNDVTGDQYLSMISGKTAAICRFACWAGAVIAGAPDSTAHALGEIGFALGIGFQLRDDLLGIWGDTSTTGKAAADDIRRRKKALPLLALLDRAIEEDRQRLLDLYSHDDLSPEQIDEVLGFMTRYEVHEIVQEEVGRWHNRAIHHLNDAPLIEPASNELLDLIRVLESRTG